VRVSNCSTAAGPPGAQLRQRRAREAHAVVVAVVVLAERDAGGHGQEVADRRAAILAAGECRHVALGRILDRGDGAVGEREPDQHRRDRLRHRERGQTVAVVAPVLVALDQDRIAARDQQPGRRIAREILIEREATAAGLARRIVGQAGSLRRALPGRGDRRAGDDGRRPDLVQP
jgi:hypothetical protein